MVCGISLDCVFDKPSYMKMLPWETVIGAYPLFLTVYFYIKFLNNQLTNKTIFNHSSYYHIYHMY